MVQTMIWRIPLYFCCVALVWGQRYAPNQAVQNLIDANVDIVNQLAQAATRHYNERCNGPNALAPCTPVACEHILDGRPHTQFGRPVITTFNERCTQECATRRLDFEKSAVRLSQSTPARSIQDKELTNDVFWTRNLDSDFMLRLGNSIESITLRWQYIGTPSGLFRGYPGDAQETCGNYDPRVRPWYVAATSGPKNVILVIDVSGSMNQRNRLELAKDAAKTVINTLTNFDFIGVVIFSDAARTVRFTTLVPATTNNINILSNEIDSIRADGQTNYEAAFTKAFNLLRDSKDKESATDCQTAILFLTDGTPTAGETGSTGLTDHVSTLNDNRDGTQKAVIFTFTLGSSAEAKIPKAIACGNRGIYVHVPDGGNLRGAMSLYYDYFATIRAADNIEAIWVEPYIDAFGLGEITTVSRALYDNTTPPRLFGVVSVDILTSDLRGADPNNWERTINFLAQQVSCPRIRNISDCFLDALRKSNGDTNSVCSTDSNNTCTASVEWTCPNHGTRPDFCSEQRNSYQSEVCTTGSSLNLLSSTVNQACCNARFHPNDVNAQIRQGCGTSGTSGTIQAHPLHFIGIVAIILYSISMTV